jgi:hypothetical protein
VYFDGRELKPYAEPVSSNELEEDAVYFAVNYVDDEMLIPLMETLVFIGRNLEPGMLERCISRMSNPFTRASLVLEVSGQAMLAFCTWTPSLKSKLPWMRSQRRSRRNCSAT